MKMYRVSVEMDQAAWDAGESVLQQAAEIYGVTALTGRARWKIVRSVYKVKVGQINALRAAERIRRAIVRSQREAAQGVTTYPTAA